MDHQIEVEREEDGRWIAEVPDLPGVMAYGNDRASAVAKVQDLARRVLAERAEHEREQCLGSRASLGSRERYDAALAEVPDVEPEAYDRLEEALAQIDPAEERALAEEGLAADLDAWPEYAQPGGEQEGRLDERDNAITARLDQIYPSEGSSLDVALRRAQRRSLELCEELDRRLADQAATSGAGKPWPEVKARLLGRE
jgi:predicted RNase H-like HicB family nuclease